MLEATVTILESIGNKKEYSKMLVAHACNPTYLGGSQFKATLGNSS
jgi:hypothetical protein